MHSCAQCISFLKKINLFILFIYFWLHWVFIAACGLSLVAVSKVYSSLPCTGFSLWWLLLLWSMGSRCVGFSSCGTQAQQLWLTGARAQAQQLWCMGLVAPWHVGSSKTRAQTHVPCIGRWTLNHCTTREAPTVHFLNDNMNTWPFYAEGGYHAYLILLFSNDLIRFCYLLLIIQISVSIIILKFKNK